MTLISCHSDVCKLTMCDNNLVLWLMRTNFQQVAITHAVGVVHRTAETEGMLITKSYISTWEYIQTFNKMIGKVTMKLLQWHSGDYVWTVAFSSMSASNCV